MEIYEKYPRLQHYTKYAGLEGILATQSLWATLFSDLNDSEEIKYATNFLPFLLMPTVEECLTELSREDVISFIRTKEDAVVEQTHILSEIFLRTLIEDKTYMLSFCEVTENNMTDGILSMWRGYGDYQDSNYSRGYAIVFKTKDLYESLEKFSEEYDMGTVLFERACYKNHGEQLIKDHLEKYEMLSNYCRKMMRASYTREREPYPTAGVEIVDFMLHTSWLSKHPGFEDEREVRLAFSPTQAHPGRVKLMKERGDTFKKEIPSPHNHPNKKILLGKHIRDANLPIEKIIIGPGKNQGENKKKVETLITKLGLTIPVENSTIPFK